MAKGILGRKIGMTQIFSEEGVLIPVTVIEAEPNVVLQVKTKETDGYEAVQLGFEDKREKVSTKSEIGYLYDIARDKGDQHRRHSLAEAVACKLHEARYAAGKEDECGN